ncbi:MAG: DNA polymerase III subunit alpha, partial [Pseudomonadota bacterium]
LRRAMGKKDKAAMAQQQAEFVQGAVANGVKEKDAADIFVMVDKFAGYGFNKSHAAAYALVAYHTAYLKANYREEFLAASMTLDMANTDKLAMFAQEARASNIPVLPPCVNASEVEFSVEAPNDDGMRPIRYALAALKNVGESAVETIVSARNENGRYADISNFAGRLNPKAVNRRALEMLSSAGAFDGFGLDRATAHDNAEQMLALASRLVANAEDGTDDLFGGGSGDGAPTLDIRKTRAWSPMVRLDREFAAIGFFLSGHPLDEYAGVLASSGIKSYADFVAGCEQGHMAGRVAGIVVAARQRKSARGNAFAFAMFSDTTGQFEAVVFSDVLNASRDLLEPGTPVVVGIEADRDGDSFKMRATGIQSLEDVARNAVQTLLVKLDPSMITAARSEFAFGELHACLKPGRGHVRIAMTLFDEERDVEFALPGRYETSPSVKGALSTLPGVLDVVHA